MATKSKWAEYPSTGIKVIIVGAGFAGLSLAIECVRNGHEVQVFESAKEFAMLGTFQTRLVELT
jgi:2-polyprenyl-6-methoxyphenol hydroxylase-like FAD-dependent oxidoreductase